jgi:hypothetical protein
METIFYAPTRGDKKKCAFDFAENNGVAENN